MAACLSVCAPTAAAGAQPTIPPPPAPRASLDYVGGTFYLRSADDDLVVTTGGRVHIDTYAFGGTGVERYHRSNGTGLTPTMFFRRFVVESGGLVRKHWFFWIGGNFAPTQIDADENPASTAGVYDGFMGYQWRHGQLYVGQYNAPFTMENVTSSRWLDFMERALSVRALGAPYNKDLGIMFWGANIEGVAPIEYQLGVFGGDGMNRPNVDDRVDGMARAIFRPLAKQTRGALGRMHLGVSARGGTRQSAYVLYDAPSLSTPGGYAFWSPVYTAADGSMVHVVPADEQIAVAGELYLPFDRIDLRGEVVYVEEGRREAPASDRRATLRRGRFAGLGAYAQVSYWPFGAPRVNGHPAGRYLGIKAPPKAQGPEHPFGLQLLLRGEVIRASYDGNARTPDVADGGISARTTAIQANALQVATNYWATKHVRVTAEYSLYLFPGAPAAAGAVQSNQAAAPGAVIAPPDPSAHVLHELSFRLGLAL